MDMGELDSCLWILAIRNLPSKIASDGRGFCMIPEWQGLIQHGAHHWKTLERSLGGWVSLTCSRNVMRMIAGTNGLNNHDLVLVRSAIASHAMEALKR